MHGDPLDNHLARARSRSQALAIVRRMTAACWPGGASDRSEPAALAWLARWHPGRAEAPLPACSCASGRCALCN